MRELRSLRSLLDDVSGPRDLAFVGELEDSVVTAHVEDEAWLRDAAGSRRREAFELVAAFPDDDDDERLAAMVEFFLWEAELYEDPQLRQRVEDLLPPEVLADLMCFAEQCRHPHRLLVEEVEDTRCNACRGTISGPAIRVDDSDGIIYCPSCVALAAEAVRGATPGS